jgi:hypothetical protein
MRNRRQVRGCKQASHARQQHELAHETHQMFAGCTQASEMCGTR